MTLAYLETSLKLMKPAYFRKMNTRKLNIYFSDLLDSSNIPYKQYKSFYVTKYSTICLLKKKEPICYMDYLMLKSNSYYYIFYNGCNLYKPQWLFLNEQKMLNIHDDFVFPHNDDFDDFVVNHSHRIDLTPYLKRNTKCNVDSF